jgi:hypothetical protein
MSENIDFRLIFVPRRGGVTEVWRKGHNTFAIFCTLHKILLGVKNMRKLKCVER